MVTHYKYPATRDDLIQNHPEVWSDDAEIIIDLMNRHQEDIVGVRDTSLPTFRKYMPMSQFKYKGHWFTLYYIHPNTHGCRGAFVTIEATSPNEGVVVDGWSCSDCYKGPQPVIAIGTRVLLPVGHTWLSASQEGKMLDTEGASLCGCTKVDPFMLI